MSVNVQTLEQSRIILKDIFQAGVKAVSPRAVIKNKVKFENGTLHVDHNSFQVADNVYLVGFGKAVMGMAIALEQILGNSLKKGIISVPSLAMNSIWGSEDMSDFPKLKTGVIEYREGSINNQPDEKSLESTHNIIDLVESLSEKDTLIVLISGGGSALLYMPRPMIDQEDKLHLCKTLQNAGADIRELNTVRKKLSLVKGGGLARLAYPASVISLILSDIVGDPIDLIASGPTVYSEKSPEDVTSILKKYNLYKGLEGDLKTIITCKETFNDAPLLNSAKEFKHVNNIVLGNNMMAVEAACIEAKRKKLTPIILRSDVTGNVQDVSLAYVHITSLICLMLENALERDEFFKKVKDIPILPLCGSKVDEIYSLLEKHNEEGIVLIGGGEPTVVVKGDGKGGRNQELALHFSLDWLAKIKSCPRLSKYDVIMLSAGTDGQDGPTDAAGAFGYPAIGPIMHDVNMMINSLTQKETVELESKKVVKENDINTQDICKATELSGYLTSRTVSKRMSKEPLSEGPVRIAEDAENMCQGINPLILQTMEVERMLPENTLSNNDTYNFYSRFKRGADLLKTGFTGTNVMDLHFIYISNRNCSCKIDYTEEGKAENCLDAHNLYIDPATVEKYKEVHTKLGFKGEKIPEEPDFRIKKEGDQLNIKIIDDNLQEPCCRRDRKFSKNVLLKDVDFL